MEIFPAGYYERHGECWVWTQGRSKAGYARYYVADTGKQVYGHEWAYEQTYGPVPEGKELDHLCRNRACVNPAHLDPVTHAENCRRGSRARLDWDAVHLMRAMFQEGVSNAQLHRAFGVSRSRVAQVTHNKEWKEDGDTPDPSFSLASFPI